VADRIGSVPLPAIWYRLHFADTAERQRDIAVEAQACACGLRCQPEG
jgi:hypothetical protein